MLLASKTVGVVNLVEGNASGTTGLLLIVQSSDSSEVTIRGRISALSSGSHGFHVHETGSTGSNCADAGGHFNPTNVRITRKFVLIDEPYIFRVSCISYKQN